jgi:hypothetical protein
MDRSNLLRLARAGALARLAEIDQERQTIFREFPDLRKTSGAAGAENAQSPATKGRRGRRGGMSAAQRKAVGERMRKYWAARRAEDGGEAKATTKGGRRRRKMSAEARKRIGDAQRKRWAEQRAKQAKAGEQGAATQSLAARGSRKKR